ncbi:MAG: hypothetical protein OSA84_03195 [Akkermansiaceae bacterium]|nr:hypothetical protein [Akkermansiaceae bacterium]
MNANGRESKVAWYPLLFKLENISDANGFPNSYFRRIRVHSRLNFFKCRCPTLPMLGFFKSLNCPVRQERQVQKTASKESLWSKILDQKTFGFGKLGELFLLGGSIPISSSTFLAGISLV